MVNEEKTEEKGRKPDMEECKQRLKSVILEKLDFSRETSDEEIRDMIDGLIIGESKKRVMHLDERNRLRQELFYSIRKLDILQELVDDPDVTEIMINGTDGIFIEREGHGSLNPGKSLRMLYSRLLPAATGRSMRHPLLWTPGWKTVPGSMLS